MQIQYNLTRARQPYQTFQGAKTPQKSCRARRNHLTPHEWDRLEQ